MDWIMIVVIMPLFIVGGWVTVVKVWRSGLDVSGAVSWFTGTGRGIRGYHAFLAPMAVAVTLLCVGFTTSAIEEQMKAPPAWLETIVGVCAGVGFLFMVIGAWMWIVQWPTFLIPPHFRDRSESEPELSDRGGRRRAG